MILVYFSARSAVTQDKKNKGDKYVHTPKNDAVTSSFLLPKQHWFSRQSKLLSRIPQLYPPIPWRSGRSKLTYYREPCVFTVFVPKYKNPLHPHTTRQRPTNTNKNRRLEKPYYPEPYTFTSSEANGENCMWTRSGLLSRSVDMRFAIRRVPRKVTTSRCCISMYDVWRKGKGKGGRRQKIRKLCSWLYKTPT